MISMLIRVTSRLQNLSTYAIMLSLLKSNNATYIQLATKYMRVDMERSIEV